MSDSIITEATKELLELRAENTRLKKQNELLRLLTRQDKHYAIAAHRRDTGELVFWHNDGQPTVWQPVVEEWKFPLSAASEIANSMRNFEFEDVRDIHVARVLEDQE